MNLLTIFTTIFLFAHSPAKAIESKADTTRIDTTRYAILPYNASRDGFMFPKESAQAEVSAEDVKLIEKIISVTITEYNKKSRNKVTDPKKYYKQIIAVKNFKGETEVWVNCFCTASEKKYWHKGVVMVLDGGPCFFNVKINLTTKTVMNLAVNGVA